MEASTGITSEPRNARSVASFDSYREAQQAVDRLSDAGFPVENVDIIGSDLRLVEHVTGRLTTGRAAMYGAGIGAWWGLLFGLLVGLFTTGPEWVGLVLGGLLIGAIFGASLGFFAHWATQGQRDFSSTSGLVAGRYDVMVANEQADRAQQLLAGTPPAQPAESDPRAS
jgi:Heat induced stress protein YflT domain